MDKISIPLRNSLSFRQAINSVLVAVCIGLFLSISQLVFDYFNHNAELENTINQFLDTAKKSATHAAYNFDDSSADQIARGLVSYAPIIQAEIRDDANNVLAHAKTTTEKEISVIRRWLFGKHRTIKNQLYTPELLGDSVGELTIIIDTARTADGFFKRAGAIFFVAIVRNTILTLALIIVFHFTLTKSILRLHGALQRGRTEQRVPVIQRHENDELGSLIREFNEHLDIIDNQHKQISGAKDNLEQQVENRTHQLERKNVELKQERELALQASKAKSDFLAMMSHEIRTPVSAVLGIIKLLMHSQLSQKQREHINVIKTSCESLVSIISDILDYAKLEKEQVKLDNANFDLPELIHSVSKLMSVQAKEKGLLWDVNIDTTMPNFLLGDSGKLKQILINLLYNAIKFTESGGVYLIVECLSNTEDKVQVKFTVKDTGIGILVDYRDRIFEEFTQVQSDENRVHGGIGIGLAICKKIVTLMDGKISVEGNQDEAGESRGSVFYFIIPFTLADGDHHTAFFQKENILPPLNILVVEDIKVNQAILVDLLLLNGHRVDTAENGLKAIEIVQNNCPDVILMDVRMPIMNGYQATQEIRQNNNKEIASVPIIGVTANAQKSDVEACLTAGMDDVIEKPISIPGLYKKIIKLVNIDFSGVDEAWLEKSDDNQYLNKVVIDQHITGLGKKRAAQLIEKALVSCKEKVIILERAAKSTNLVLLRDESHALAGIAKNFGFLILSEVATHTEEVAKKDDLKSIIELIEDLYMVVGATSKSYQSIYKVDLDVS